MKKIDITLLGTTCLLVIIGLLAIYSSASSQYLFRQLIFLSIGITSLLIACFTPRRLIYGIAEIFYGLTLLLLILVLIFGSGPGAHRWFAIRIFNFQPSELAKISTVIILAKYLSYRRKMDFDFKTLAGPTAIIIPVVTLILLEPDLSTSISFLPMYAALLYWQGLRPLYILLLFIPVLSFIAGFSLYFWIPFFTIISIIVFLRLRFFQALAAIATSSFFGLLSPVFLSLLKDYQRARIKSFFAPWLDPHGMGWNIIQSQIAIGSGRIFGKGYLNGSQKRLGFLPNRHTDFIFSCIAEEFGLIGSIILLVIFGLLIYRLLLIAYKTRDQNGALITIGFAAIIGYHVFVNIGMLLGILPVTGITLPLISYGGSSLVVTMTMIGFALNVAMNSE
ncbi:MAG: rod shape-determining protein RodA [candidate division WOR-3 bacterium]